MAGERPDTSKSKDIDHQGQHFQYVDPPTPGICRTVNTSVENLATTFGKSHLYDFDDQGDQEMKTNEASSDPVDTRELNHKLNKAQRDLKKAERSERARSARSLSPKNQHRRGARDAKGRIPRTRDASRESSVGEDVDDSTKRRRPARGKAVSYDNGNNASGSVGGETSSHGQQNAARGYTERQFLEIADRLRRWS